MFNCIVKHTLEYFCIKSTSGCAELLCFLGFFVSLCVRALQSLLSLSVCEVECLCLFSPLFPSLCEVVAGVY